MAKIMIEKKPKLFYVLPKYEAHDATHFSYLVDFLGEVSKFFDIFLLVEKGGIPENDLGCVKSVCLRSKTAASRFLEMFFWMTRARFSGWRDFYIHYSFSAAFSASLIAKIFGGRVFYWNCGEPWKFKRPFWREIFERMNYKLISFLVTGAASLAEKYSQVYGIPLVRTKVMANWINLSSHQEMQREIKGQILRSNLNIPEGAKVLLFIHRLSRRKGAHLLPEILKGLKDRNVFLIVAGDGPEREHLEAEFKKEGLDSRVKMLGWVPNREVVKYFSLTDVFLMPSQEEGFPHVLLESMAWRVPFVVANVGAVEEIIPAFEGDYLVNGEEVADFVLKTGKLLDVDAEELAGMKNDLAEWVKRYDIAAAKNQFVDLIKGIKPQSPAAAGDSKGESPRRAAGY